MSLGIPSPKEDPQNNDIKRYKHHLAPHKPHREDPLCVEPCRPPPVLLV